jgi:hypothetical protein
MNTWTQRWCHPACLALAGTAILMAAAGCEPTDQRGLTILLLEYQGPQAVESAERLKKELTDQGLPGVFTVSGEGRASVCVGRYASWKDSDADAMLKRVRVIRDATGQYPFAGVVLMPIPEEPPENPWPLEKARGFYTLHVASWEARGRMAAAQAFASELRSRGFEAYVYHGPRLSMVTIGAFGPEIFDRPSLVGQPGAKPKVVGPAVLDLIQRFPRMRLEGQDTPPEAHVPTQLVQIPGRQAPAAPHLMIPRSLYRLSLSLVDTKTGLAEGLARVSGVAQSPQELPVLTAALARQMVEALPAKRTVRVGVVGIVATDAEAAKDRADATVLNTLAAALATVNKIVLLGPEGTRQTLDAAGLNPADVLRDPRLAKGFTGLDFIVVGTVTSSRTSGAP